MDRQDKDRAAFEEFYGLPRMDSDGNFKDRRDEAAYKLWQAARDHYAPKLTEAEAVEKAAVALYNLEHKTQLDKVAEFESYWRKNAQVALRAAGVQFRDEPNPEPGACQ
jgi:hypothetical protein